MLELAQVFDYFYDEFEKIYPQSPAVRKTLNDLRCCQSVYFGGDKLRCDHCEYEHFVYHSCKNRFCPKCYQKQQDQWIEKRREELLDYLYFHVVLTVPQYLHQVSKLHQQEVDSIIMFEAAAAIQKLCRDPKYIGGQVGIMEVLHTWTRDLRYHPHVHCLIPAGGLNKEGEWSPCRANYLIPVEALSDIFRAKVRDALKKAGLFRYVTKKAWQVRWVTFAKPSVQGVDKVLKYLARYVFRAPICNSNIIKIDRKNKKVTFRYCDHKKGWQTSTLTAGQFIARVIQHILPKGLRKVRYYGFWSPSQKNKLKRVISLVGKAIININKASLPREITRCCPECKTGQLIHSGIILRQRWRAPP